MVILWSTRGRKGLASETFLVLPDFSGLIITNTHLIYVIINELMHGIMVYIELLK